MKKIIFIMFLVLVAILTGLLFGRGLLLQIQVALTPAKIIKEVACGNDYLFQVKEDQNVVFSTFDTPYPTHINTYRNINLVHSGKVVASINPAAIDNFAYGNGFPAGESFIQTYVFDKQAITPGLDNKTTWRVLKVQSSQVSQQDFKGVAQCLYNNRFVLLGLVDEIKSDGSAMQSLNPASAQSQIGWIMLVDSSIKRDANLNAPEFICTDGNNVVTLDNFIQRVTPFGIVGVLAPDGAIYKPNGPTVDIAQPQVTLPDVQCVNSKGENLRDYIKSIPNRITFLSN